MPIGKMLARFSWRHLVHARRYADEFEHALDGSDARWRRLGGDARARVSSRCRSSGYSGGALSENGIGSEERQAAEGHVFVGRFTSLATASSTRAWSSESLSDEKMLRRVNWSGAPLERSPSSSEKSSGVSTSRASPSRCEMTPGQRHPPETGANAVARSMRVNSIRYYANLSLAQRDRAVTGLNRLAASGPLVVLNRLFKQRHSHDVQALLDADTTRLDVGVLIARSKIVSADAAELRTALKVRSLTQVQSVRLWRA